MVAANKLFYAVFFGALVAAAMPVAAQQPVPGTVVKAEVLSIVDGDTIHVKAEIWKNQYLITNVRLRGIDTPELRTPQCEEEKALAIKAKNLLEKLISGDAVFLKEIDHDKYGDRVLAKVITAKNLDISQELLSAHLAVPYAGQKRQSWCH